MAETFTNSMPALMQPAVGALAITPSDTVALTTKIRQLTVGTAAGVVVYVGWDGATYTTGSLPVGTYPMYATFIKATGTTATGLTGWI